MKKESPFISIAFVENRETTEKHEHSNITISTRVIITFIDDFYE